MLASLKLSSLKMFYKFFTLFTKSFSGNTFKHKWLPYRITIQKEKEDEVVVEPLFKMLYNRAINILEIDCLSTHTHSIRITEEDKEGGREADRQQ